MYKRQVLALFTNFPKLADDAAFNQALCGLYAAGLGLRPAAPVAAPVAAAPVAAASAAAPVVTTSVSAAPGAAASAAGTPSGSVSYTNPTLPTSDLGEISVVAVCLKKKNKKSG